MNRLARAGPGSLFDSNYQHTRAETGQGRIARPDPFETVLSRQNADWSDQI